MNDFELYAHVTQIQLATRYLLPLEHIVNGCDNTSATSWATKGSISRHGAASALLLLKAQLLRKHRLSSSTNYLPGSMNILADTPSRFSHLSDSHLIAWFNLYFPQYQSWKICHLTHDEQRELFTALRGVRCTKGLSSPENA